MNNPFSLEELDNLQKARETDDVEYLKNWSKAAVKWYEKEKKRLFAGPPYPSYGVPTKPDDLRQRFTNIYVGPPYLTNLETERTGDIFLTEEQRKAHEEHLKKQKKEDP